MTEGLQQAGQQDDNDRTGMQGDDSDTNVMFLGQEQDQPVAVAEVVFWEAQLEREFQKGGVCVVDFGAAELSKAAVVGYGRGVLH